MPPGTRYQLEVNPKIPKRLARLEELASPQGALTRELCALIETL